MIGYWLLAKGDFMPKVGKTHYGYDSTSRKKAKAAAKRRGLKVVYRKKKKK